MQVSPSGMAAASQAVPGEFDSRHLLQLSTLPRPWTIRGLEVCFAFYPRFPLNNKDFVIIFQIKKENYDFCRIYIIEGFLQRREK